MIKQIDKKYVNNILELHKKSIYPLWKKLKRDFNDKQIKDFIVFDFKHGKVFGYFLEDSLVGCASFIINKKGKVCEIGMILVDKNYWGEGIGRKLMNFVEDYAKKHDIKRVKLDVLAKNPAVKFYEKLDYQPFKIIMEKKL